MIPTGPDQQFDAWLAALEERHLSSLRFNEVSRALRALSATYVERRGRIARGAALDGGGKRAAFALTYAPLHFLTLRAIAQSGAAAQVHLDTIVDLGCGTGAAGAAWALALPSRPSVLGVDRHKWAVTEAASTYRHFGLRARTLQADAVRARLPTRRTGLLAGWFINELDAAARLALLDRLLAARRRGATLFVVEPIARAVTPWWDSWAEVFAREGGRSDEWRFRVPLPSLVQRLDRAAGLSHEELTARSLWLPGRMPQRSIAIGDAALDVTSVTPEVYLPD